MITAPFPQELPSYTLLGQYPNDAATVQEMDEFFPRLPYTLEKRLDITFFLFDNKEVWEKLLSVAGPGSLYQEQFMEFAEKYIVPFLAPRRKSLRVFANVAPQKSVVGI